NQLHVETGQNSSQFNQAGLIADAQERTLDFAEVHSLPTFWPLEPRIKHRTNTEKRQDSSVFFSYLCFIRVPSVAMRFLNKRVQVGPLGCGRRPECRRANPRPRSRPKRPPPAGPIPQIPCVPAASLRAPTPAKVLPEPASAAPGTTAADRRSTASPPAAVPLPPASAPPLLSRGHTSLRPVSPVDRA